MGHPIAPENKAALEDIGAYLVRAPLSLEKLVYLDEKQAVLYRSKMNPGLGRNFEALDPLEWLARMTDHIPDPGKHRTLLYGAYANRTRGTKEPKPQDEQPLPKRNRCGAAGRALSTRSTASISSSVAAVWANSASLPTSRICFRSSRSSTAWVCRPSRPRNPRPHLATSVSSPWMDEEGREIGEVSEPVQPQFSTSPEGGRLLGGPGLSGKASEGGAPGAATKAKAINTTLRGPGGTAHPGGLAQPRADRMA